MGVNALWQLLAAEHVVEHYRGTSTEGFAKIVEAADGAVVAVDLSPWIMQADQQQALAPHFTREERCMKVAFERAVQWLRHGCLPVIVVEGLPPQEKRAAQQARFAARNGYAGGGSQAGASQFQRLGQTVGGLLEELGLPVFYAPGEAEAACAALSRAGCVDACASPDGDTLLYGAESLCHTLKLLTGQPRECELKRVSMAAVRRRLGLRAGGAKALGVLAMLSGSDYDLEGAQGVGSAGGLAVARYLLLGGRKAGGAAAAAATQSEGQEQVVEEDDDKVLERLAELVQRPARQDLLALTKCTGCSSCGHEGGRAGKIKRHTSKNPCSCCPPAEDGGCRAVSFGRCQCAFHRLETERRVERILERVRRKPSFLAEAQAAIAVFERQGAEAEAAVAQRLQELGCGPGQKLRWLHRPRVRAVFEYIDARRRQLLWDLSAVRGKVLPVLLEWDLQHQPTTQEERTEDSGKAAAGVEFRAAEVQKVHGQKSKAEEQTGAHWRYVLRWERLEGDSEDLGPLEVQPKKPRSRPTSAPGAAAAPASLDAGEGAERGSDNGGDGAELLSQPVGSHPVVSQPAGSQPVPVGEVEVMTAREFDLQWLKEQTAEHRAARISAVQRFLPSLDRQYRQRLAGGGSDAAGSGGKKKAAGGAQRGSGGKKSAAGGGVRKPRAGGSKAPADQKLLLSEGVAEEGLQHRDGDLTQYLIQRKPGGQPAISSTAAAAAGRGKRGMAAAEGCRRHGLTQGDGAAAGQPLQQQQYQQYLPDSAEDVQSLLSRIMGGGSQSAGASQASGAAGAAAGHKTQQSQQQQSSQQQQQRRHQHPPPLQHGSPEKKQRNKSQQPSGRRAGTSFATDTGAIAGGAAETEGAAGCAAPPRLDGASPAPSPGDFEIVLSSPESPRFVAAAAARHASRAGDGAEEDTMAGRQQGRSGSRARVALGDAVNGGRDGGPQGSSSPLPLRERMMLVARGFQRLAALELEGQLPGSQAGQLSGSQPPALQQQRQEQEEDQGQRQGRAQLPLPPAQQQQRQKQQPRRGAGAQRRGSGGGDPGGNADIRSFLSPASPMQPSTSPREQAALAAAGLAAGHRADVVDLTTPPPARLGARNAAPVLEAAEGRHGGTSRLAADGGTAGIATQQQQAQQPQQNQMQQLTAGHAQGSPVDLTIDSDSD